MELFDRTGKPIRHARDIRYDNAVSGLTAEEVQAAIDEIVASGGGYTDEQAQDAVGLILTNTATIEFTYTDGTPAITADLSAAVIASLALADAAVQPGDDVSDLVNDAGYITSASLPAGADPTASVGLTAVNGSALTFMRSDGAPALDQGIAPTWTGAHTFASVVTLTAAGSGPAATATLALSSSLPYIALNETGATANNRLWRNYAAGESLIFDAPLDTGTGSAVWMQVDRTANAIDSVSFPNGVVLIPDGGANAPAIAFGANPNTGIYRSTTDRMVFSAGGNALLVVGEWLGGSPNEVGVLGRGLVNVNGTAAAPSYAFTADANTGMYRIGANILGFSTDSVERVRITGTEILVNDSASAFTSPGRSLLKLNGSIDTLIDFGIGGISQSYIYTSSGELRLATIGTADLIFYTNSAENLRLDSVGRLFGKALHNNSSSPTGTTNQYIASGTYTPTLTNVLNAPTLVSAVGQWMRVGNLVTVSGQFTVTQGSNGATQIGISLPLASALTATNQCAGNAAATGFAAQIRGDTTNDRAEVNASYAGSGAAITLMFTFTYLML